MKAVVIAGIVLIVVGIAGLATGGFSFTHQKKDVDVGPIQISHNSTEHVQVSPILSGIAIVAGLGLVFAGSRK